MSGMDFKLTGFAELETRLHQLADVEATKAGQSAIGSAATRLKNKVIATAPRSNVPEGAKSRRHRKDGTHTERVHSKIVNNVKTKKVRSEAGKVTSAVYVGTKAYHASFVEFGSIHNAPNPFMKRAVDQNTAEIINQIATALNRQLIKRGVK